MKWIKRILLSVVVLILIGASGYFLYDAAYAGGEKAGYENGYPVGREAGYSLGEQDGYNEGYVSGEQDGYDDGYTLGKQDGYSEGYILGKDDGYAEGYDKIREDVLKHGYTLRDPTYEEVIAFLKRDKTDENEYVEDSYGVYVCSHYARDVNNNAEQEGLRCAFVEIRYLGGGHTIICFNTTDRGLVYFEPQNDWIVIPVVGKRYHQCVEPAPGYYCEIPPFDDTIMDILVIW